MVEIAKFTLFLLFFVYFPGRLFLTLAKIKISPAVDHLVSSAIGIPIITFVDWVCGYLGVRVLTFPILLLADFYLIFALRPRLEIPHLTRSYWFPGLIIFLGALFQILLMAKSGTDYKGGLAFWGVNGYDGVWHAALVQELTNYFPPQNPGFAGELLKNYHFLTDLFYANIHRATGIPILSLYFRLCPIFLALLLNGLIFVFAKKWSGKSSVAGWTIFFSSIAGSFGWIPPILGKGSNNWETAFWGIQPTSAFLNPSFAVSLILLLTDLIFLNEYLRKKSPGLALGLFFLSGILVGFKIYAGIIVLGGLGVLGIVRVLRGEKDLVLIAIMAGLFGLVVYWPAGSGANNYLVWQPWWFIQTMIEAPDRLNWSSLELRRQVYVAYNDWISLFLLQSMAFLIFLVGNLGIRFLGFLAVIKRFWGRQLMDWFLVLLLILAFLPPIFFIQRVVPWNCIQFFYYFTFLFSFFAAETVAKLFQKIKPVFLKVVLVIFIILPAMPSTIETIWWFNAPTPTTLLDQKELEALKFLNNKSKISDVLLTYPYDAYVQKSFKEPPVPMTYYNSPYVSFFTERRVYLEDLNAATLLSYDIDSRLKKEKDFFSFSNSSESLSFLKGNKISYIYLVDGQGPDLRPEEIGLKKVFDNQKVRIYEVNDKI